MTLDIPGISIHAIGHPSKTLTHRKGRLEKHFRDWRNGDSHSFLRALNSLQGHREGSIEA